MEFDKLDIAKQYEVVADIYFLEKEKHQDIIADWLTLGRTRFKNSTYTHFLALTDYMFKNVKERLYISTTGFLKPYQPFIEVLKEEIKTVKEVKILSLASQEDEKETAKFFTETLGVKDKDYKWKEDSNFVHTIVTDDCSRVSLAPCTRDTKVNEIKAEVVLNTKGYADKVAEEFKKVF